MNRFPDGARVCFIGDSMTAANEILPRVIDHYNKHFSNHGITFYNCGTSGGTYGSAITFFEDDILPHKPTHAVLASGINDAQSSLLKRPKSAERYTLLVQAFENYQTNLEKLVEMLRQRGVCITLCTPMVYDEYTENPNETLRGCYALTQGYAEFVRNFAREQGLPLCDYFAALSAQMAEESEPLIKDDRVHPNSHGYYRMAKCFLASQGLKIDEEAPIPECFDAWRTAVRRLRLIYGAEQMIVRDYGLPEEEKLAKVQDILDNHKWKNPAQEPSIRGFLADKRNQSALYSLIDRLYEEHLRPHKTQSF